LVDDPPERKSMKLCKEGGLRVSAPSRKPANALALVLWASIKVGIGTAAPVSGAPFLQPSGSGALPSPREDENDQNMLVARLSSNALRRRPAHVCDDGKQADRMKCLQTAGRGCMWTRIETRNPRLHVQESYSYCLPCELDGEEIPCWNVGARIGDKQVTDCAMSCSHQRRIWQPQYACSDGQGSVISETQCFDRGTQSSSKCMFLQYEDTEGNSRGSCGPCELTGSGSWGCPPAGSAGPEEGSRVTSCRSQCDITEADDLPLTSPGIAQVRSPPDKMLSAPLGAAVLHAAADGPDPSDAAAKAAKTGGQQGRALRRREPHTRVVIYRTPGDFRATTLPPVPSWPPPWWNSSRPWS